MWIGLFATAYLATFTTGWLFVAGAAVLNEREERQRWVARLVGRSDEPLAV